MILLVGFVVLSLLLFGDYFCVIVLFVLVCFL